MLDFKTASLQEVLNHKTMYYDKIDFSIVKKSWDILSKYIKIPFVLHIVGTNGKGSTGRFLAHYLNKKSFKVVHYSSPHILKFNERIWINGKDSSDFELTYANGVIQKYLPINLLERLTYFEYTTLLSLVLSDGCDYLVFEAGLGGEFDATNVVPADISLITTIDLDHQSFLGNSVEEIARTKMRATDKKMIIGYQIHNEVYDTAKIVKQELKDEFDRDVVVKRIANFEEYKLNDKFPVFLKRNLHLVIAVLKELKIDIDVKLFDDVKLFGRCQKVAPNITVDVGHNPLAARALLNEFKNKKVNLIYNSYKDKDYKEVLKILKPIISTLTIMDLSDKRIVDKNSLLDICRSLNIIINTNYEIKNDKEYLVFGSFLVVEKFLRDLEFNEK